MTTISKTFRIALFASGEGSNAEAIVRYFANNPTIEVALMVCNRKEAGVYERMQKWGIPCHTIGKTEWQPGSSGQQVLDLMRSEGISLIVLAGFLAYIPEAIVKTYSKFVVTLRTLYHYYWVCSLNIFSPILSMFYSLSHSLLHYYII
jgi:phosphoribosylglycinamide formyltransferase-1